MICSRTISRECFSSRRNKRGKDIRAVADRPRAEFQHEEHQRRHKYREFYCEWRIESEGVLICAENNKFFILSRRERIYKFFLLPFSRRARLRSEIVALGLYMKDLFASRWTSRVISCNATKRRISFFPPAHSPPVSNGALYFLRKLKTILVVVARRYDGGTIRGSMTVVSAGRRRPVLGPPTLILLTNISKFCLTNDLLHVHSDTRTHSRAHTRAYMHIRIYMTHKHAHVLKD